MEVGSPGSEKLEHSSGALPSEPESTGNNDFAAAFHQGLSGEVTEEPTGDLARAVKEGYEKGRQVGSEVDPLEIGKVFQDNPSEEATTESPQEL